MQRPRGVHNVAWIRVEEKQPMRIMLIHPNYRSGGAEIAGNWPPAWAPYLAGALRRAGFTDISFVDAMTEGLDEAALAERIAGHHRHDCDHALDLRGRARA